jgi:putative membrane protein
MIIEFSPRLWQQAWSILRNNRWEILASGAWAVVVYGAFHYLDWTIMLIPVPAITLVGAALAFFLAFRNNSAYDRWWESRKIWGGIVNVSRTFASRLLSSAPELAVDERRRIVYRHLAYINALRVQFRERDEWPEVEPFLDPAEYEGLADKRNRATHIVYTQTLELQRLKQNGVLDSFDHYHLGRLIERLYDLQGMAERIKKTVFPAFYTYFTRLFLLLFVVVLPGGLVRDMDWHAIPLCVAISFIFIILEKTGRVTEEPLEARSSGTPMGAICRTIEIDLRQMLGETELPEPYPVKVTRHGSRFLD